jgi:hypothetical protein
MIEVEFIRGTAHDALTTVALPYLKLDVCRDDATADWMNRNGNVEQRALSIFCLFLSLNCVYCTCKILNVLR